MCQRNHDQCTGIWGAPVRGRVPASGLRLGMLAHQASKSESSRMNDRSGRTVFSETRHEQSSDSIYYRTLPDGGDQRRRARANEVHASPPTPPAHRGPRKSLQPKIFFLRRVVRGPSGQPVGVPRRVGNAVRTSSCRFTEVVSLNTVVDSTQSYQGIDTSSRWRNWPTDRSTHRRVSRAAWPIPGIGSLSAPTRCLF